MKSSLCNTLIIPLMMELFRPASSFAPSNINALSSTSTTQQPTSSLNMVPLEGMNAINSASSLISTISADIDNIPSNEFATVFAGGITVMIGGVLSTVMVGFLLESGNSYASVVADSYAQGGDEEFWESLSPEDQVKTRELMEKLRQSKEGKGKGSVPAAPTADAVIATKAVTEPEKVGAGSKKEEISMFSDYED